MNAELVNKLLAAGVGYGASDIHFKVGSAPSYRVDGQLRSLKADALKPQDTLDICKVLCADVAEPPEFSTLREFDTSYSMPGTARFRVNIYRQRGTLSAILRIIPREVPNIESLGLPMHVTKFAEHERGLVLVTGATGSGKSSTLASLINHINRTRSVHILTIEDPIEFLHQNDRASVSQREIGLDTANFSLALRAALRQDPDVILVGEMRDTETVDIALKAAETGHMVYSTVHTTDASKTVNRLIAMFPPEEQPTIRMRLAEILKGTISQRLLPRADGKGRALACEIMTSTETVKEYVRDASRTSGLKDVLEKGSNQYGMQTFDQHLIRLVRDGVITKAVALTAASSPADFERSMHFE
jgi:twitching motility protein PilT